MTRQWDEAEVVMISALQHFVYCPRQCALIHIERVFDENVHTLRGRRIHERVDEGGAETEEGVRSERSVPIWSDQYGLIGKADQVEFPGGVPYPVEYKHGRLKKKSFHADAVQLCAQALCLEEMTGKTISRGAIYYFSSRGRREVEFTEALRLATMEVITGTRELLTHDPLPSPANDARCAECSLHDICAPELASKKSINIFTPLPER